MKKLLFIFALPFLFTSCGSDRFDSNRLQNMKKPVIVIGVAKEVRDTRNNEIVTYGNIVLRDKDYNIESFRSNEFLDVLLLNPIILVTPLNKKYMFLGVCEKLERDTGMNAWLFRLLFVLFGFSCTGLIIYFVLYLLND